MGHISNIKSSDKTDQNTLSPWKVIKTKKLIEDEWLTLRADTCETETRLRHIFYLGKLMERQAEAFYRRFAEKAQDDDLRGLYGQLAEEEVRHFKLLDGQLSRWKSLRIDKIDLTAMDADGKLRQMFLSPPDTNATEKEIIDYAIDQEKKMVAFYQSFEREFNDFWKSTKLAALVAEEKTHIRILSGMRSIREKEC